MSLIQVQNVSMEFAGTYVLKDISCVIAPNSKIGMIGANGSGKSTLIKIMLGFLEPSEGLVSTAKKIEICYLAQNMQLDPDQIMIDYIHKSRADIFETWKNVERLNHEFQDLSLQDCRSRTTETIQKELEQALNLYQELGGYEFDNEVKFVLTSLGFPPETWNKHIRCYSGGEQTRICLAAILLRPFDLLVLDEPTNHLDVAMISWLERYLGKLGKPFLVVSHDRTFLDNTVNSIYHLESGNISITKGNYSSFFEARKIALLAQQREYERQQKYIAETKAFIQKNIAGQKTLQAKSRLKTLNRLEIIDKPSSQRRMNLAIEKNARSGNDVYVLENVLLGISKNQILSQEINLRAIYQEKICILGPNGCGKTTLLKCLIGEREVLDGKLKIGASLEIGYYDQYQSILNEALTVCETLWQIVPSEPIGYVLSWLARFGFKGDDVDKKVSVLSGGEKSRLSLSVLIHENPNLLILDEPTNHLDIEMTDSLLTALQNYSGTIIFVSHDRYLMRQLATKYWVFHKKSNGERIYSTITELEADHEKALELSFLIPEIEKAAPPPRERRKKINPWHLEQLHKKIEDLNREAAELHEQLIEINMALADSKTYADEKRVLLFKQEYTGIENKITQIKEQISLYEEEYLELCYE
ncbi:MAG: ABC-F family ATP-binding cassette domain-containing protein [Candidatus Cloacimonetes bacterium]|nr:ABC-F family ATP-binding cassette domain-containing protein [Candidatus Cloacimonadota bacterium]